MQKNQKPDSIKKTKKFISKISILSLFLPFILILVPTGLQSVTEFTLKPVEDYYIGNSLLQFTSSGHVLGFGQREMYVVGTGHMLKVSFMGARSITPMTPAGIEGKTPDVRFTQLLDKVTYTDLWKGITLIYKKSGRGVVKSTYRISAGTNPKCLDQIRLRYNVPVHMDDKGNLVMFFEKGEMRESAPVAWQEIDGKRVPVAVAYHLLGEHDVGFRVGNYNPFYTLILDPELIWNTFMGSSNIEYGQAIAVDNNGNVYVSGRGHATWGSPVNAFADFTDAFVVKLNNSGVLLWNTFLGGTGSEEGNSLALDNSGNVYVTGFSGPTWGSPVNPHSTGGQEAYAAKLNNDGVLQWNTFMGSVLGDQGGGIAVDNSDGSVYVIGGSEATWGTPVNAHAGGGKYDAFAVKLNSSGDYQWHTFMGSAVAATDYETGGGIALDSSGNAYVTGRSAATWGSSPVNAYAGGATDTYVAKLNSSGTLLWNTFMGSSVKDGGMGLTLDKGGNVYVSGYSYATWGSPIDPYTGNQDVFVAKLNDNGVRIWNTFMGSSPDDYPGNDLVAVDRSANIYIASSSFATWGSPVNAHNTGNWDAFAARIKPVLKTIRFYFSQSHNLED